MMIALRRSRISVKRMVGMALVLSAFTRVAYAQSVPSPMNEAAPTAIEAGLIFSPVALGAASPIAAPAPRLATSSAASPSFVALQIGFGALQAMDVYSTMRALDAGSTEANPLVRGAARHPMALSTVKLAGATSSLLLLRHVNTRNRILAAATLAAVNGAYAIVVTRNLRTAGPR